MSRFTFKQLLYRAALSSLATSVAVSLFSKRQTGHAAAGLNATSHIVWGKRAFDVDKADVTHTVVGAALNAGAMLAWSAVHELLPRPRSLPGRALKGGAIAALAYVTDYYLVPERLTPGFEQRLSLPALASVYGVTALAFGFSDGAAADAPV